MQFSDFDFDDRLLDALDSMRFEKCTPIQEKAIPPLLQGRDIIGIAQTGTGKTAAYLTPVINRLTTKRFPKDAINCIIMTPTRELARQIDQAMEAFSYFLPVSSLAVYGGNDGIRYEQELRGMQRGADVIIATPGRLISHIQLGNIDLSRVSIFILDEADRMLDMGFIDDIKAIMAHLPAKRQTMLFSATMPDEIRRLAQTILHDPVRIEIAITKPAEKIQQSAYICYETQKIGLLRHIFHNNQPHRVIIFASSKRKVKELAAALRSNTYSIGEMHSDLPQQQRDSVMQQFRAGHTDILVATDIIARGIDIDDIQMVINYDVPRDVEDYVHRIGRTARAERDGQAVTLVSDSDRHYFARIQRTLRQHINMPPLPSSLGEAPTNDAQLHRPHGTKTDGNKPNGKRRHRHTTHSGRKRQNSSADKKQQTTSDI